VQHYEVPTRFFQHVLGPRLKYGCCYYAHTLEDWLRRGDARRDALRELFQADLGRVEGKLQFQRWRLFFMACAELFAYRGGNEWFVAHYLFGRRRIG
jgi:cyclopropane-fatty-acyl-phospholipid synthase